MNIKNKFSESIKGINKKIIFLILSVLLLGILLGRLTSGSRSESATGQSELLTHEETIWTCSMHPQIRQDHPGICPLCGMDLTPLEDEEESDLPVDALRMSPSAMQLASIHTMPVVVGDISKEIRLAGKVSLNPRYAFSQNAHIGGRIEELYVNTMGEYVQKGQRIALLYSPELINTQKELIQTYQQRESYPALFEAVKQKLQLWKVSQEQIEEIIAQGRPIEQFPIYANATGYLISKEVDNGDYIESGKSLFKLAQLDKLWIEFDVYEKDASFIRKGIQIEYDLPSIPGRTFKGVIDFVEPILKPETRTLTARVNITNTGMMFKPEMLVNGRVYSKLSVGGDQIVIPKSAVMWTGKNSIVYVKYTTDQHVGFQMRPVVLGPSLEDSYVILEGLELGEEIVVEGTFSVDAAAQLANKPSMMNHVHPAAHRLDIPKITLNADQQKLLKGVLDIYLSLKDALVKDDFETAKKEYIRLTQIWAATQWDQMPSDTKTAFEKATSKNALIQTHIAKINTINHLRDSFFDLSNIFIEIVDAFGSPYSELYLQHCPMANNDQGADWLSQEDQVLNPYYGASMLRCGEVKKKF